MTDLIAKLRALQAAAANCKYIDDDQEIEYAFACHTHMPEILAELERLQQRLDKQERALALVLYMNRSRGYPTGHEWMQLITEVTQILEDGK